MARLLGALQQVDGIEWIRLLYLYPTTIGDDVLEAMATHDKVCRYVDLPLQHASDAVLKRMKRPGTRAGYEKLLDRIRTRVPDVTLRTTVIVGYPGETADDFAELQAFVKAVEFDHLGVFTYSHEEGTTAHDLRRRRPGRAPKSAAASSLMALQKRIVARTHRARVGRPGPPARGRPVGRARARPAGPGRPARRPTSTRSSTSPTATRRRWRQDSSSTPKSSPARATTCSREPRWLSPNSRDTLGGHLGWERFLVGSCPLFVFLGQFFCAQRVNRYRQGTASRTGRTECSRWTPFGPLPSAWRAPGGSKCGTSRAGARPRGHVVRIFIDRPGPAATPEESVSVEDCEQVNRELSTILDVEDPLPFAYVLEVSSPGLNRPLRGAGDYARFAGRLAKVVVSEAVDNQKAFEGRLRGVEDDAVVLEASNGRKHRLPLRLITRGRLEVEF